MSLDYKSHAASHSHKVGHPALPGSSPAKVLQLCSKCFSKIGARKTHICQKTIRRENLSNIVKNVSCRSRATVTSNTLKSIAAEEDISTKGGTLNLTTRSKPLPVRIGTPKVQPKEPTFSHDNLKRLQADSNLSDKSLK